MDRNKPPSGTRGPYKGKITPPDLFIALGSKSAATSRDTDPQKRNVSIMPKTPVVASASAKAHVSERKRETPPNIGGSQVPPLKKLKSLSRTPSSSSTLSSSSQLAPADNQEAWEACAIEVDSAELLPAVEASLRVNDTEKAVCLVLGALRTLRSPPRLKPCKITYSSVMLLCQVYPTLLQHELVTSALMHCLKREPNAGGTVKSTKPNMYHQILFVNILLMAYRESATWPESFLRLYIEDAVGERVWIDNIYCKPFVDNIIAVFNTKVPPKSLLTITDTWTAPAGRETGSPLTVNANDDDEVAAEHRSNVETWSINVFSRYTHIQSQVETLVLEAIQEQITRRQQPEAFTKNFLRLLSSMCGLVEIRMIAVSRLETWIHNHKLMKPAQELLAYVCYNCTAQTPRHFEVVVQLSKLRLKSKPMVNFFNNCLREMVLAMPDVLAPLMKYTIYNELSNVRNANNLFIINTLFQVAPEASSDAFGDIILELLLNKDDYLRSLRALFKEMNRVLKHDFNLLLIVRSLVRERKEKDNEKLLRESEVKDRVFQSMLDLLAMCMLLSVTPQVRDASTQSKRDLGVLHAFQAQVSNMQREAVTWLHDWGYKVFRPPLEVAQHALLKVLLLEQPEAYYKVDSWPGENERILFLRLAGEVPLAQATLLRLLLIGISKDNVLAPMEVIDIADQIVRRAGGIPEDSLPPLTMDKIEIVDFFFNMSSYHPPEVIALPAGYMAPKLAITQVYWKSLMLLLILGAHNPTTFGALAWEKYPTLRMFMEMCITNCFSYPPPTMMAGDVAEDYSLKEQQILAIERQTILEFETHLAAATTGAEINEQSSHLLAQLMGLDPSGAPRKPPKLVLEQLQKLNAALRLGHLLCRSRQPDFLLEIMTRHHGHHGTANMPWLAELVHFTEGSLADLPVQCLCEYLLSTGPMEKLTKHAHVLVYLRQIISGKDATMACEVLEYLLRRLTSLYASSRAPAIRGLTLLLSSESNTAEVEESASALWLLQDMVQFAHLPTVRPMLILYLRQALLIETNPVHVANYISFLCTQGLLNASMVNIFEMVFDLATLVIERNSITHYILPGENMETVKCLLSTFWLYFQIARTSNEICYGPDSQEHVMITWANGEHCTMMNVIIHASIILLSHGPIEDNEAFSGILNFWFPPNEEHPKATSLDLAEEVNITPDWLKLRMIRSNVPRLLDAAVQKLEASQLVLFIQSFGIPVASISKLLHVLDRVTVTQPTLVIDSVLDKTYMIQLVDVQNRRGAVGGKIFVKALEMQSTPSYDEEMDIAFETKKTLPVIEKMDPNASSIDITASLRKFFYESNATSMLTVNQICRGVETEDIATILTFLEQLGRDDLVRASKTMKVQTILRSVFNQRHRDGRTIRLAQKYLVFVPGEQLLRKYLEAVDMAMDVDDPSKKLNRVDALLNNSKTLAQHISRELVHNRCEQNTGLMVDWLAIVELEMANVDSNPGQMELLFYKQQFPYRPLLTSIVLQRASWRTLSKVVDYLLDGTGAANSLHCPTAVLDFLEALAKSPRLWQGRDKSTPKHHKPTDVLNLDEAKTLTMIDYIIAEAKLHDAMERRLALILVSMNNTKNNVHSLTEGIVQKLVGMDTREPRAHDLLLMLYMQLPRIGAHLNQRQLNDFRFNKSSLSALDIISHSILSAMTANTRMKDWHQKSNDLELCARKLAASHPDLMLRQLPMLASSLQGRSLYDWKLLKSRSHLLLFGQVCGLMELLQPMIYKETHTLYPLLDGFVELIKTHGMNRELGSIVQSIANFIQDWMMHDMHNAISYLQRQGYVFNDIEGVHPCVRPLLASVALASGGDSQTRRCTEILVGTPTAPVLQPPPPNWQALVVGIQSTDPLAYLQEIEHLTAKRAHLLAPIARHLYNRIDSRNGQVRVVAIKLMTRYLKHNPKASKDALPAVLSCLDSKDADVVETILDRLPELIIVMQEYAKSILTRVYQLGIQSNLSAAGNVGKCIANLCLQMGC